MSASREERPCGAFGGSGCSSGWASTPRSGRRRPSGDRPRWKPSNAPTTTATRRDSSRTRTNPSDPPRGPKDAIYLMHEYINNPGPNDDIFFHNAEVGQIDLNSKESVERT